MGEAVTEMTDAEVFGAPKEMSDADVFGTPPINSEADVAQAALGVPEAFLDRVRAGQALTRITMAAGKSASEGAGTGTPTGFEDETLNHLIDLGVFHDPLKSKPGPIQMANEAVLLPAAQVWQSITRAMSGGIHGAGGAFGQIVEEFGSSQGEANRAKNEVINFGNWALIEGGMGRFSRPAVEPGGVAHQTVGGLPVEADFVNAGKVLAPREAPIAQFRRDAAVINEALPPVAEGEVRLWRGNRFGEVGENPHFTNSLEGIALPFREGYGGPLSYVDVPAADLAKYTDTGTVAPGAEMTLPPELAANAKVVAVGRGPTAAEIVEENLRRMWREDGIHPAEAVHDAANDAFLKHEITARRTEVALDPADVEVLTETGGKPHSLGAAANTDPPFVSLDVQPAQRPGSMIAAAQAAADKLFDVGRDIQMKLTPMARGTAESMATVKDYMNSMRRNAWDSSRIDADIQKRFSPEQRARMARAMEEESLSLRLGEPEGAREHQGLATLAPEERAAVINLDTAQQMAWLRARDLGMVEGDGIPMHFPRMATGAKGDTEIGKPPSLTQMYGIRKNSPYLQKREYMEAEETERALKIKYGDQATIAWDIRSVNLATKMLEDAVAGRTLIRNIEEVGKRTGDDAVAVGFKPGDDWFTVDHPAFQKWRPKIGSDGVLKAEDGSPVFESVPIYVRGDFEGPIRAALWGKNSEAYGALMSLKGKTMGLIMNSPMIHNLVEFGRAFPAMPTRIVKAYFDGYRAKHDVAVMHEAIDAGLVPIGKRFFNQDIDSMMETPDLVPGRSITSKIAAFMPGLYDEAAGVAVKRAIDKAGDFWHNTLLWDRIADLQMGLYTNFRGDMMAKGMDQTTASRVAAHLANRYAGALPKEAMSEAATKISNFMFFSRSFTFGNLGVMKDMFTGLPKDVIAQIERDAGFKAGAINEAGEAAGPEAMAVTTAKSMARRKAIATIGLDLALMYAGNSVLQSAFNVMLGQGGWTQEGHEYMRRFRDLMSEATVHPLSLLNPFHVAEKLSATDDNESGRKERVMIGYAKDGTAIYARNPVGKIGEEFSGYFGSPLDMIKKKEGTILRPGLQLLFNDAGYGRKIYDPKADSMGKYAGNIWAIVKHMVGSQLPAGQITAFSDLVQGEGDSKVNALQAFGPFAGVTFSKGAPGGPAVGEMYDAKGQHQFAVDQALPDIRKQIKRGDINGATDRLIDLGVPRGLRRFYVNSTLDPSLRMSPRAVRDFYRYTGPEQQDRFERARQAPPQP